MTKSDANVSKRENISVALIGQYQDGIPPLPYLRQITILVGLHHDYQWVAQITYLKNKKNVPISLPRQGTNIRSELSIITNIVL